MSYLAALALLSLAWLVVATLVLAVVRSRQAWPTDDDKNGGWYLLAYGPATLLFSVAVALMWCVDNASWGMSRLLRRRPPTAPSAASRP